MTLTFDEWRRRALDDLSRPRTYQEAVRIFAGAPYLKRAVAALAYGDEVEALERIAVALGLAPAETHQIFDAVNAEAQASTTWGSVEQRLAEIRRRIHLAAK